MKLSSQLLTIAALASAAVAARPARAADPTTADCLARPRARWRCAMNTSCARRAPSF